MKANLNTLKGKIIRLAIFIVLGGIMAACSTGNEKATGKLAIIPLPTESTISDNTIEWISFGSIISDKQVDEDILQLYESELEKFIDKDDPKQFEIRLKSKENLSQDQYQLEINEKCIEIYADSKAGYFYALQSLKQILLTTSKGELPLVKISDQPRFKWRGVHLDVSRHFFGVKKVKEILDWMAFYKMNRFHWHLVDDQGWRIEIKKYPKLTSVGSVRTETDGTIDGPYFYTQEEIKEVVNYAADRNIEVIPEIELPGHTTSVLAAYPHLSCTGKPMKVGNTWGVYKDVYCAGSEESFEFIENVLSEVIDLFPCEYLHIGGDECPKDRWAECLKCQQRIREEKLADESELQAYFIERVAHFLELKGKILIGWDEILEGYLAENAVVMSWHGIECGELAVRSGNPAIMTPRDFVYFNKYQGEIDSEPLAMTGYIPLEKAYSLNPMPEGLTKVQQELVLGVQANIWTEHIHTEEQLDYMMMPRLIALAEVAWSPKESKDFGNFKQRLLKHYPILDAWNVNYHVAIPSGGSNSELIIGEEELKFHAQDSDVQLYKLSGKKDPLLLEEALKLSKSEKFQVYSQLPNGKKSKLRNITVEKVTPIKGTSPTDVKGPGLHFRWFKGNINSISEIQDHHWIEAGKVKEPGKARSILKDEEEGVIKLTGYIKIFETGIYEFKGHPDQLKIGGESVLDCEGKSKRILYTNQVALEKGWHRIEAIFLVKDYDSIPKSKVKTEIEFRLKNKKWETIKSYCYMAK